jgi:hypothetical protein
MDTLDFEDLFGYNSFDFDSELGAVSASVSGSASLSAGTKAKAKAKVTTKATAPIFAAALPYPNDGFWNTDIGKAVKAQPAEVEKIRKIGIAKYVADLKAALAIKAAPVSTLPFPNDGFWKTDIGIAVMAKPVEIEKIRKIGIAKYVADLKAALTVTQPAPLPVVTPPASTLPFPNDGFWKSDIGLSIITKPVEIEKIRKIGIPAYIEELKAALAVAKTAVVVSAPPVLVVSEKKITDSAPVNYLTQTKPVSAPTTQVMLPANPVLPTPCVCDNKQVPISVLQTPAPSPKGGADGFWNTELGREILNNPAELAKFTADPTGYMAAIKAVAPEVAHIKDVAMFLGCKASNEDIKRYLLSLQARDQATMEHNALVSQSDFRKATISKLNRIMQYLPQSNAVQIIRTACGIG